MASMASAAVRAQAIAASCSMRGIYVVQRRGTAAVRLASSRSISSSSSSFKSKRSLASEPAPDTPGEVPVMRTKGKGPKGAHSTPRGQRSKHAEKVEPEKNDERRYRTTTTNDELPGEKFDEQGQKENMERAVKRCRETITRIVGSHGRADPAILDGVRVQLPSDQPPEGDQKNRQQVGPSYNIKEFATIGVRDGSLIVTCFDPSSIKYVERAIHLADMGLTPQHVPGAEEGILRIPIPRPTSESRAQLAKDVSRICENARVSIRTARQIAKKQIDGDVKDKVIGADEGRKEMSRIEEETKNRTAEVNKIQEDAKKRLEQ